MLENLIERRVMQVIFFLQTRRPAILPPICNLFRQPADDIEERPLHLGQLPDPAVIEVGCGNALVRFNYLYT